MAGDSCRNAIRPTVEVRSRSNRIPMEIARGRSQITGAALDNCAPQRTSITEDNSESAINRGG